MGRWVPGRLASPARPAARVTERESPKPECALPLLPDTPARPPPLHLRCPAFASSFDIPCDQSLRADVCEVVGRAQDLAEICSSNPACLGFVYLPNGLDFRSAVSGAEGGYGFTYK